MRGIIVGVLRGGPSEAHHASIRSGSAVVAHMPYDRYTVRDVYIDRTGMWHERGRPITPERVLRTIDVAVIAIHGPYGGNGEIQRLLDAYSVPYTGADSFASFITMHKVLGKEKAKEVGLRTPEYRHVDRIEDIDAVVAEAIRSMHQPVVVKPSGWSVSHGVTVAGGYASVHAAVQDLFERGANGVLIEERILGKDASVGIVERMRGERLYSLPPVEVLPDANYLCPAHFSAAVSQELMRSAQAMHDALGLKHYSRSDFIVSPRGVYYLETNSAADCNLSPEESLPKSLAAVGVSFPSFLSHIVDLAVAA